MKSTQESRDLYETALKTFKCREYDFEENWDDLTEDKKMSFTEMFKNRNVKAEYEATAKLLNDKQHQFDLYLFKLFNATPPSRLSAYDNCFDLMRSPPKGQWCDGSSTG